MNYTGLIKAIQSATAQLQSRVATVANQALVIRNWIVGAWVVEFEQNGKDRAKYGERLLESIAKDLAHRQIKGLELRTLRNCRLLYAAYPQIRQTVSAESGPPLIRGTVSRQLSEIIPVTVLPDASDSIRHTPSAELIPSVQIW